MIVTCENCGTKFRLDESLLAEEGSKVRCSICKHVFLASPPPKPLSEQEFEEIIPLDSPPPESKEPTDTSVDAEMAFEGIFEEALEEKEVPAPESSGGQDMDAMPQVPDQELLEPEEEEESEEAVEIAAPEREVASVQPAKKSGISKTLLVMVIVFVLLAGGAVAVIRWAPQLMPDFLSQLKMVERPQVIDKGIQRLSFKGVAGSFLNTKKAGRLFVIRGVVTNGYPNSRRFILIKGTILDDKGKVVRKKLAYAGNSFTKEEINNMSFAELEKAMKNRLGRDGKDADIPADATIPFMIVFRNLPGNLSEFTVEAVSSSPIKQE